MSDELPRRRRSLDSLKKEAKRWLDELRANAADARARLQRALPNVPAAPTLRDVQHALAREQGFPGWAALKQALASDRAAGGRAFAEYEVMAEALLDARLKRIARAGGVRTETAIREGRLIEEIERVRKDKVTREELDDAKAYLTGSKLLDFATDAGIAAQLLGIERYGLGFDYLKDFERVVNAVTADDILEVAKKHLDTEKMVLVASGPIDDKGKVLERKKD